VGQILAMTFTKHHISPSFPWLSAVLALALLSGCDQLTQSTGLTGLVGQVSPAPIAADRMRVTLPKVGAQATLAPVAQYESITVWQTLDGITLTFHKGAISSTRGLGEDLMSSDTSTTVAMLEGGLDDEYYPVIRSYLDGEDRTYFRSYQCRKEQEAKQKIDHGNRAIMARLLKEVCVSPTHRFSNIYWLDSAQSVIRSRQWVSHSVGDMVTERVMR
jgi:hypothetical protein